MRHPRGSPRPKIRAANGEADARALETTPLGRNTGNSFKKTIADSKSGPVAVGTPRGPIQKFQHFGANLLTVFVRPSLPASEALKTPRTFAKEPTKGPTKNPEG